jgi:hypothetical protein
MRWRTLWGDAVLMLGAVLSAASNLMLRGWPHAGVNTLIFVSSADSCGSIASAGHCAYLSSLTNELLSHPSALFSSRDAAAAEVSGGLFELCGARSATAIFHRHSTAGTAGVDC